MSNTCIITGELTFLVSQESYLPPITISLMLLMMVIVIKAFEQELKLEYRQ